MSNYLFFELKNLSQLEDALEELQRLGLTTPCVIEDHDNQSALISGVAASSIAPQLTDPVDMGPIDWEAQWGCEQLSLDLSDYGITSPLLLDPGAGFGDFTHPTTQLTLQLMSEIVADCQLIDIGSGSGILSLASLLMGAKRAYALDICPHAREHTLMNATLNGLEEKVIIGESLTELPTEPLLIVMNMIWSEQIEAWGASESLHGTQSPLITSGILKEESENYLSFAQKQGWVVEKTLEKEGWMAFLFNRKAIS